MKLDLKKILEELKPYRERKTQIDQKHAALLAIDMQNFFHRIAQPVLRNILRVVQILPTKKYPCHLHPAWSHRTGFRWWNTRRVVGRVDHRRDGGLEISS